MAIETRAFEYPAGGATMRGQLSRGPSSELPQPGVLVAHTWAGCGPFERDKAARLAEMGYVALAVDMYGHGVLGSGPEENAALMAPLIEDRELLQGRMQAALTALKGVDGVDASRVGAIGFCFGGLCVLDLARSGADFQAAVSFHGLLDPPPGQQPSEILAKVLVLHGWDDPMARPASVNALAAELTKGGTDWQIHAYGGTVHAFTNPAANNAEMGTVYDPVADARSWRSMRDFLGDVLRP